MDAQKKQIADALASHLPLPVDKIASMIGPCKRPEHGDLAFPCFLAAKEMKKAPPLIAKELESALAGYEFAEVKAVGPFLNFKLDEAAVAKQVLNSIFEPEFYGASTVGEGKTIVIDYSSPNIAKPFGIGHLRSTIIGASLKKLYQSQGYKVVGVNHLGDWGTQFGLMICAWHKYGDSFDPEKDVVDQFYKFYVRINEEARKDEAVHKEGREWFRKLEAGDEEALKLWTFFRDNSLKEFQSIYDMLGVSFECVQGESFYNDKMEGIVEKLSEREITETSQGALIIDLDKHAKNLGKVLLRRDDGATLYMTRDLAAAYYRAAEFKPHEVLYVVGMPQRQHFQQLFKILELMGEDWAGGFKHVAFGHYLGMSTRDGTLVFLREVLERTSKMATEIAEGLRTREAVELTPEEIREVGLSVGIGAVIFFDFKSRRTRDLEFSWEHMLNLRGDTGPYVQWTHARCCGILRKNDRKITSDVDFSLLNGDEARALFKVLLRFPNEISRALAESEPSLIASYLIDLAHVANAFIHVSNVIRSEDNLRNARALVVDCTRKVLRQGLELLGVKALEKM